MAKSINLGNGSLLVGLDSYGQVKDFYFDFPGLENHVSHHQVHKIGVLVDEQFSWLDSGSWEITVLSADDTMASQITAVHKDFGITLQFSDVIYNEENVFVRKVIVQNTFQRKRKVKLFFNQQFEISQARTGNTAYYDPTDNVVIHYKGRRVFLINATCDREGIDEYSVGLFGIEGKEGTFKDAEDGSLSQNPIEHGQVDSVVSLSFDVSSKSDTSCYYWIVCGKSIEKVKKINELVRTRGAEDIIKTTKDYWRAWVTVHHCDPLYLPEPVMNEYRKSLFTIRTHVSKNGAIIASGDSDMLQFGRDTYAYVWPRDAAYIAISLLKAGDVNATKRFFLFCNDILSEKGYFMHKYRPDKAMGSSWHPWVDGKLEQIPIQEDETAIVLIALWEHFQKTKDLEFIESIYNTFIKKAAEFMLSYRDDKTGLPKESYDLWEMYYGISTYTSSSVYGALIAASKFANLLGKRESEEKYRQAADTIRKAILKYLYDEEKGLFYKYLKISSKDRIIDSTYDISSVYGLLRFGVLPLSDKRLSKAFDTYVERLTVRTPIGGIARYEGDIYHHKGGDYPGNPWIITTLWYAEYIILKAKGKADLKEAEKILIWVTNHASSSGMLSEQLDPYSGEALSASPLIWSHAAFVSTVLLFIERAKEMEKV